MRTMPKLSKLVYNGFMLTATEHNLLQTFVANSRPGAPYVRRAHLLLLVDDGVDPERAAAQVAVSVTQARNLLRAFKRQRLELFPETLFRSAPLFPADAPIAEAARAIMAGQFHQVLEKETLVRETASVTAVHEMRKAIRALSTALKLFGPFFAPGVLAAYRRPLRKIMRRLGRSRDRAVFLEQLNHFIEETAPAEREAVGLRALAGYWEKEKAVADQEVVHYLGQSQPRLFLDELGNFLCNEGEGVAAQPEAWAPVKARHLAPRLIYERLAAVRAFDEYLKQVSSREMHRLRIRMKELRYTLQFFEPIMGATVVDAITTVKQLQQHLGSLNDGRIALQLMDEMDTEETAAAVQQYRAVQTENVARLMDDFRPLWQAFDSFAWRQKLALSIAML
jgi:CHAD domain-containing protein